MTRGPLSFILQEQKKETVKQSFAQVPKNIHPLKLARTIVGIKPKEALSTSWAGSLQYEIYVDIPFLQKQNDL